MVDRDECWDLRTQSDLQTYWLRDARVCMDMQWGTEEWQIFSEEECIRLDRVYQPSRDDDEGSDTEAILGIIWSVVGCCICLGVTGAFAVAWVKMGRKLGFSFRD